MVRVIQVIADEDGSEAIYADGVLHPIVGNTVFAGDIANAIWDSDGESANVTFSYSDLNCKGGPWPETLKELLNREEQYVRQV